MSTNLVRTLSLPIQTIRNVILTKGFAVAHRELDQLMQDHPDEPDLYALKVLTTYWRGDHAEANQMVAPGLKQGRNAGMLAVASELAHLEGENQAAYDFILQAAKIDPDHYLVLRQQIQLKLVEGETEAAIGLSRRHLDVYPEDTDAYSWLILARQMAGDLEAQDLLVEQAPSWFKESAKFHYRLGMLEVQRRNLNVAEQELRLAVASSPEVGSYWSGLGMVLSFLSQFDEAERACQFALEINSTEELAFKTMARIYEQRGDVVKSAEFKEKATNALPALKYQNQCNESLRLIRLGKVRKGLGLLDRLIATAPKSQTFYPRITVVGALADIKEWEEARKRHDEALRDLGSHAQLKVSEFRILVQENRTAEARRLLNELMSSDHSPPEILPSAIAFLVKQGEQNLADQLIERTLRDLPGTPAILCIIIVMLNELGRPAQATELHDKASRRYPEDTLLRRIAVSLALLDDDLARAMRIRNSLPPNLRRKTRPNQPGRIAVSLKGSWQRVRNLFSKKDREN